MAHDATPPAPSPGVLSAAVATPEPAARPRTEGRLRAALGDDWTRSLRVAWQATWVSRLVVWLAGGLTFVVAGNQPQGAGFDPTHATSGFGAVGNVLMAPAARWDANWYATIANGGYGDDTQRPAFFPLYPLAMKVVGFFTGSAMIAGVLISLAAMLVGLTLLHRLAEIELGPRAAALSVWALALFPMSFFLSAVYSEALFFALSVGAVLAARQEHWAIAGLLGGLAAATRSAGVLLVVALALMWFSQRDHVRWTRALWIALVPLGPALICAWFAAKGHDALAPFHAQSQWYRTFAGPFVGVWDGAVAFWDGLRQLLSGQTEHVYFTKAGGDPMQVAWRNVVPFLFLLVAIPAVVGTFRRLPLAYGAYVVAALALPLSYPVGPLPLMSFARFLLVLFPLFMWGGAWLADGGAGRRYGVLGASTVGLALASALFATWFWVA